MNKQIYKSNLEKEQKQLSINKSAEMQPDIDYTVKGVPIIARKESQLDPALRKILYDRWWNKGAARTLRNTICKLQDWIVSNQEDLTIQNIVEKLETLKPKERKKVSPEERAAKVAVEIKKLNLTAEQIAILLKK